MTSDHIKRALDLCSHLDREHFASGGAVARLLPSNLGQGFAGSGAMHWHNAIGRAHFADGGDASQAPTDPAAPPAGSTASFVDRVKAWAPTTWPVQAAKAAYGAVTLPGDVYSGAADMRTPEAQNRAMDLVGTMAGAGAPMAEEGALGILGGRGARTADLSKDVLARDMRAVGSTPDDIWKKTGWYNGVDGKSRFEIPDDKASLKDFPPVPFMGSGLDTTVGQMLNHDDLFKAYPDLADIPVHRGFDGLIPGSNGSYGSPDFGYERIALSPSLAPNQAHSTLLHELQHAVQTRENFAVGSSPNIEQKWVPASKDRVDARLLQRYAGEDVTKPTQLDDWDHPAIEKFRKKMGRDPSNNGIDLSINKTPKEIDNLPPDALTAYKRSAGEVEARNVQFRAGMSPQERAAESPEWTADVPSQYQIVRDKIAGPIISPQLDASGALTIGGRPALADGGGLDHALWVSRGSPMSERPHFEAGGEASRGYGGSSDSSSSSNNDSSSGGYGGGYGGFGFGGGNVSSVSSGKSDTSNNAVSKSSFNSGAPAGSTTGGYGGFGGYSSSASVGGSYNGAGGLGSYNSSGVSSAGSSSQNAGYGSVSGALGEHAGNSYGGSMQSGGGSNSSGGNNGGFGGLSGISASAFSGTDGFGHFNSNNYGNGVGGEVPASGFGGAATQAALGQAAQSFSTGSGFGDAATQAAFGKAAQAFSSTGSAQDGSYGGYRAGTVSNPGFTGAPNNYGSNDAATSENHMAGALAASGGFGNVTDNNPGFTSQGADASVPGTVSHKAQGFGSFGDESTPSIGTMDHQLSSLGYGSFNTPAATAYASANSLAGQGVTPGIGNTGGMDASTGMSPAASAAFSAGVNAGAAVESGMAGPGLTAANDGLATQHNTLSPSIKAAMGSYANPDAGTMAGSAIAGDASTKYAGRTDYGNIHTTAVGGQPDQSGTTSADPAGALTVHGPYSGVTTADTLGAGQAPISAFGAGLASPATQGSLSPAQVAQQKAYDAQHADLATKTQAMNDGIDNAPSAFRGMVGGFLGAEPDAIKGFLSNPQQNPQVAAAMTARLGQLQHEVDTNNVGGVFSTDRHGLDAMMSQGGYKNETDAINAAKGFISSKMSDVAPHFSTTGTPGFSLGASPAMGSSVGSGADSFGVGGGMSPSVAAAAGLGDPASAYGQRALTVHGPMESTPFSGTAQPSDDSGNKTYSGNIPGLMSHMNAMENQYGLPSGSLARTAQVESRGIPDAISPTGAAGEFQFTDGTAKQYHLSNPNDPVAATTAAAQLAADNIKGLTNYLGRAPTEAETYQAHQQGLAGAKALLGSPNMNAAAALASAYGGNIAAAKHAITVNGGNPDGTAAEFSAVVQGLYNSASGGRSNGPNNANATRGMALNSGIMGNGMTAPAGFGPYSSANPGVMGTPTGPYGALPDYSAPGALPSFVGMDNALTAAGVPGTSVTGDAAPGAVTVTGDPVAKKADELTTAQKVAKFGVNAALGVVPGVGLVNGLSGLLGYGTIGEYLARNGASAQVGDPSLAGSDHSSAGNGYTPQPTGYGSGQGYGALDPSTPSSAPQGPPPVDANAAARAIMTANGNTTQGGMVIPGMPAGMGQPDLAKFYNPMQDPVVLRALQAARGGR